MLFRLRLQVVGHFRPGLGFVTCSGLDSFEGSAALGFGLKVQELSLLHAVGLA